MYTYVKKVKQNLRFLEKLQYLIFFTKISDYRILSHSTNESAFEIRQKSVLYESENKG